MKVFSGINLFGRMIESKSGLSESNIKPRFEFRTFGSNFKKEIAKMEKLSSPLTKEGNERDSNEIYILSKKNDSYNIKIRDNKLDIKFLVLTLDQFEQWKPILKAEFPISSSLVKNDIVPLLKIHFSEKLIDHFMQEEFLELIAQQADLFIVEVMKKRFAFNVNQSICEWAFVTINGVELFTISAESEDADDLSKTVKSIGLDQFENINYLQGIKRTIGMTDKSLAN